MKLLIVLSIGSFLALPAMGQSRGSGASSSTKTKGVSFDAELGYPSVTLQNPDGRNVFYTGIAVQGRMILPLAESTHFGLGIYGQMRYLDLQNTANSENQKEVANHIGPGAGLQLNIHRLFAGADIDYMVARHYGVGTFSNAMTYRYQVLNSYAGIRVDFGQLSIAGSYSIATATIPKSETRLSKDTPYKDEIFWLHFTYCTGASFGDFLVKLFK